MRTLPHPWDWIGHFLWFFLMTWFMSPVWAVIVCAVCLEIDQWWTWHGKGWKWWDCAVDLVADGLGIFLAMLVMGH